MPADTTPKATERPVGQGFSLVMRLRQPSQLTHLLKELEEKHRPRIRAQLRALRYVHFSRFVPVPDRGLLIIVTEFDGDQRDYVMDFATVLDAEFSFLLSFMEDAPRLPVSRYPDEFYAYIQRNTSLQLPLQPARPMPDVIATYAGRSALEILGDEVFAPPVGIATSRTLRQEQSLDEAALQDIQANVLQGTGATMARHFLVGFGGGDFRRNLSRLANQVGSHDDATRRRAEAGPAADSAEDECIVNVGFTGPGLLHCHLPRDLWRRLPTAFREGPARRARTRLGEDSKRWSFGVLDADGDDQIGAVVSLSARRADVLEAKSADIRSMLGVDCVEEFTAEALPDQGVHFGYRDDVSQPRIAGVAYKRASGGGTVPPGDFVLGRGERYVNSRGGHFIGDLPGTLALHGTYAAFEVIEQHVDAFDDFLEKAVRTLQELRIGSSDAERREIVKSRLMGRRSNGASLYGDGLEVDDDFDYDARPEPAGDRRGEVCPFGSHVRRLNPRGGVVVGAPEGRRIIRRGMPFGAKGAEACGLVGHFYCGDLESQFEFIVHAWANGDLAAPGLKGTVDPFIGARPGADGTTPFRFRHRDVEGESVSVELEVPRLTTLRGALYLFMPGKAALHRLATRGWDTEREASEDPPVARVGVEPASAADARETLRGFNPTDARFAQMPYRFYAAMRHVNGGIHRIGLPYNAHWVTTHAGVAEALQREDVFVKPGLGRGPASPSPPFDAVARLKDGLFFQDLARHRQVRPLLNPGFSESIDAHALSQQIRAVADELLDACARKGVFDLVADFAAPLPMKVFMAVMGIPPMHEALVDGWVRAALDGRDEMAPAAKRIAGGTARYALGTYFNALRQHPSEQCPAATVMAAIRAHTDCAADPAHLDADEAANTALHFALGGYLSTEFLITTGVYHLLTSGQWTVLRDRRGLLPQAMREMLRFDAPFTMADRWVEHETTLQGVAIPARSKVVLVYGSANRDRVFGDDAEAFDIRRDGGPESFAFGGAFYRQPEDRQQEYSCIGAQLARRVARVAFDSLLDRFPDARIGEIGPWLSDPYFRSLRRLTLLAG